MVASAVSIVSFPSLTFTCTAWLDVLSSFQAGSSLKTLQATWWKKSAYVPRKDAQINRREIFRAVVTDGARITLPKALRYSLGIRPGTVLEFREENGRLIAEKAIQTDPLAQVLGCMQSDKSTDELLEELRGRP
jgi:AbrB family looped-hinge helix DNA binding protein